MEPAEAIAESDRLHFGSSHGQGCVRMVVGKKIQGVLPSSISVTGLRSSCSEPSRNRRSLGIRWELVTLAVRVIARRRFLPLAECKPPARPNYPGSLQ